MLQAILLLKCLVCGCVGESVGTVGGAVFDVEMTALGAAIVLVQERLFRLK